MSSAGNGVQRNGTSVKTAKRLSKRKRLPWEEAEGWAAVDVGDELLVGASEGGFCCLEELTPRSGMVVDGGSAETPKVVKTAKAAKTAKTAKTESAETEGATGKISPGKKRLKKESEKKQKAEKASGGSGLSAPDKLSQLQDQLARLEAENKRLKETFQQLSDGGALLPEEQDAEGVAAAPDKALNSKQRKKLKREALLLGRREEQRKRRRESRQAGKKPKETNPPVGEERETAAKLPEMDSPARAVDVSAWKSFQLEEEIEAALASLGFSNPTPIQQECLPAAIRDRRDVIGAAQTGSGKTLAFGLPIIQALLAEKKRSNPSEATAEGEEVPERCLRALILAPTRELALQVCAHLQAVAKPCGVWAVPIVGGISLPKQERLLKVQPEIVVATPGRLWELMREGASHLTDMRRLSFLVLDEADRMVQQGHFEELSSIFDFVPRGDERGRTPPAAAESQSETVGKAQKQRKLQTFVFSATLTMPENLRQRVRKGGGGATGSATLEALMDKIPFREKPKIADLSNERRLADKVVESYLECTEAERDERLFYILTQHPGRTLVFANAVSTVRRLAAILRLLQLPVTPLHASMQQRQRLKGLDRFRNSSEAILVATDVAARGLDIQNVACVVHYQIPAAVDVYVHRCGRTARAEAEGASIALVTPKESARFSALLKALGREAPPRFPLDASLLPGAHKRVRLAARLDEKLRLCSKKSAHKSWEEKAAEAAGIELSGSEDEGEGDDEGEGTGSAQALQQELAALLQEPLQPKYSQRFFAGAPSAALAGKSQAGNAENATDAVAKAVGHATRLAAARKTAAAAESKKQKRKVKRKAGKKSEHGPNVAVQARRSGSRKARFVVIPGAVARDASGPNALEALRKKLAPV